MPQNPTNITESPEFKDFCKKNNLDVFNQEAINVFLFEIYRNYKEWVNWFFDHDERITNLEEENKKLREMINEIAKNLKLGSN